MKCHYCGAEVAEGHNFCLWCGTRQNVEEVRLPEPEEILSAETPAEIPEQLPEVAELEDFPEITVQPELILAERPQPEPQTVKCPPRLQLPTGRGLGKMILLGLLTLGIYPAVIWSRIVTELNIAASRQDGKRTMPYFAMATLTPITLGIYAFVWMHKFCRRIGDELNRRDLGCKFGPSDFWLWNVLGSLIIVGPFIFTHKLMKAMNKINGDFNING